MLKWAGKIDAQLKDVASEGDDSFHSLKVDLLPFARCEASCRRFSGLTGVVSDVFYAGVGDWLRLERRLPQDTSCWFWIE